MASFNSINGVKMHGYRDLLTGVLRDEFGFKGMVVGDWNAHGQVAGCKVDDCPQSLLAGLDIYMVPDDWRALHAHEGRRLRVRLADGRAIALEMDTEKEHLFNAKFACPHCNYSIAELEPRLFSFNAPFGACPVCDGLGVELFFDERLVVPDQGLTLGQGALAPWAKSKSPYFTQTIEAIAHAKQTMTEGEFRRAFGNQRTEWDAGSRFDFENPEYR